MLKEKVIELLKKNPELLDMSDFLYETECGTAGCLAGFICMAAELPLKRRNLEEDRKVLIIDFNSCSPEQKSILNKKYLSPDIAAFNLWENEYGYEAASDLPFYSCYWTFKDNQLQGKTKTEAFNNLNAQNVIDYLESLPY